MLLWGGLFFFMMRYGCGAHMMGGHGGHGHRGHGGAAPGSEVKDPVCGMAVDPKNAAAASVRAGITYYFCSTSCRDTFEQSPEKYVGSAYQVEQQPGGHHCG
jgi:YHS domain-containing protein